MQGPIKLLQKSNICFIEFFMEKRKTAGLKWPLKNN